jgi:SAM-dependent methyltransferase
MEHDLARKTIADFGEQWLSYRKNPGYYGSIELLADLFGPLFSIHAIAGSRVADIGSGTGRIVKMLLDAGAAHVYAVEPSEAMAVLRENTAACADRVTCIQDVGESLPSGLDLDLVVSIGVLHHIPRPDPVVRAAYTALRPGGHLLVWLYGREGNEAYLRFARPLRRVTVHMPHFALVGATCICGFALDAYIALCRFLPLPMRSYMREVLAKFPRATRRLTIYDQLNPAYAKYYTKEEARALLAAAGFQDVQTYRRHGYSWTGIGTKPELTAS